MNTCVQHSAHACATAHTHTHTHTYLFLFRSLSLPFPVAGTSSDRPRSLGCGLCMSGYFSVNAAVQCTPCDPGSFSLAGAFQCMQCLPGYFGGGPTADGSDSVCTMTPPGNDDHTSQMQRRTHIEHGGRRMCRVVSLVASHVCHAIHADDMLFMPCFNVFVHRLL